MATAEKARVIRFIFFGTILAVLSNEQLDENTIKIASLTDDVCPEDITHVSRKRRRTPSARV